MDLSFEREIRVPVGDPQLATIAIEKLLVLQAGESAPLFTARTIDGETVDLATLRGKVVLLDFWATWCAPCIAQLPHLKRLHETYAESKAFVVIGVSLDENVEAVRQFVSARKIPWAQIVGGPTPDNPVAAQFNVSSVPATFLIDQDGKLIVQNAQGAVLDMHVKRLLERGDTRASR